MKMYFIALVAPEKINRTVLKWKEMMQNRYDCSVALRSPAHITLIPPFWMKEELQEPLISSLKSFSFTPGGFEIELNGFSHFTNKVIFVNVLKNHTLLLLKGELEIYLKDRQEFPVIPDDREYHPHITIATRDLHKKAFHDAWEIFSKMEYHAEWMADSISVLVHDKKKWDVINTSQLNK